MEWFGGRVNFGWAGVIICVPQESILGPLLFIIANGLDCGITSDIRKFKTQKYSD